jgi:hypothetical protein
MRFSITIAAASAVLFSLTSPALARPSSAYNLNRRATDVANDTTITSDMGYTANITNSTFAPNGTNSTDEYEDCEDEEDTDPSFALNSTSPDSTSASFPSQTAGAGTGGDEEEDCEEYEDDDGSDDDAALDQEEGEDCEDDEGDIIASSTAAASSSAHSPIVSDKVLAGVPPAGNASPSVSAFYSTPTVATNSAAAATIAQDSDATEGCGQVSL